LLAARWYYSRNHRDKAFDAYDYLNKYLYDQLLYYDFIAILDLYITRGEFRNACDFGQKLLKACGLRPGFHYYIGKANFEMENFAEAWERSFFEQFCIGEYGAYRKKANELFVALMKMEDDTWLQHVRAFYRHYQRAKFKKRKRLALPYHIKALDEIKIAEAKMPRPFIFVKQVRYEEEADICDLTGGSNQMAEAGFNEIISLQPDFIPAYLQLANIKRKDGDIGEARRLWEIANRILPSHDSVLEFWNHIHTRETEISLQDF
jgi:tetratricopeptide (TPR) repeat protein